MLLYHLQYIYITRKPDYSKHPPKTAIQEFTQTDFPTFGPSVCRKRFCSISPNRFGHFSKTSPKNGHPRIRENRLPKIRDHLLKNSKKSGWTFFQNIPQKRPSKNSRKPPSQHSRPFLYFFAGLQIRSIMVCT